MSTIYPADVSAPHLNLHILYCYILIITKNVLLDQKPAVHRYPSLKHEVNRHSSHCFVDFIINEVKIADINLLLQEAIIREINRKLMWLATVACLAYLQEGKLRALMTTALQVS